MLSLFDRQGRTVTSAEMTTHAPIAQDVFCQSCGYNLRGLTGDRCPECGADIAGIRTPVTSAPSFFDRGVKLL